MTLCVLIPPHINNSWFLPSVVSTRRMVAVLFSKGLSPYMVLNLVKERNFS
jgi:hypothetical protein